MMNIQILKEQMKQGMSRTGRGLGRGSGMSGGRRTLNAPMFAYKILYNKTPPSMSGRSVSHPEKLYKGVSIDKEIPNKALDKLFILKGIEPRSSCQGEDEDHPTFFIFRPEKQDESYVKKIVENLNQYDDVSAGYDIGGSGFYRICVTTKLWPEKDGTEFRKWWIELPDKIKKSL